MNKKTIKRFAVFALTISILLLANCILSACGLLSCEPSLTDDELADQVIEQIITAVNSRDKEELQSLFSKQAENDALEEGISISNKIDNFFELFQDEITKWERLNGGAQVSEQLSYGRIDQKRIRTVYSVYTSEQQYRFYIIDYPINIINPENVGLHTLWIVREEEWVNQLINLDQMEEIPGVYYRPGYNPTDDANDE